MTKDAEGVGNLCNRSRRNQVIALPIVTSSWGTSWRQNFDVLPKRRHLLHCSGEQVLENTLKMML